MRGLIFAALLLFPFAALAQDKPMQLDIADDRVDITTGFNGADIVLFGTLKDENANVAVTIKGPEKTMVVRRKDRILGSWINHQSIKFRRVPSYYDYAMTAGEAAIARNPNIANAGQIGVDNLDFYADDDDDAPEVIGHFRDALIRQMQQKDFFPIRAGTLQFIDPHFFKATFELPPGVPTGVYTLEAILVKDGAILGRESKTLQVGQVGFNAAVWLFAEHDSFLYGVVSVLIALISGWSAFMFLRRD